MNNFKKALRMAEKAARKRFYNPELKRQTPIDLVEYNTYKSEVYNAINKRIKVRLPLGVKL